MCDYLDIYNWTVGLKASYVSNSFCNEEWFDFDKEEDAVNWSNYHFLATLNNYDKVKLYSFSEDHDEQGRITKFTVSFTMSNSTSHDKADVTFAGIDLDSKYPAYMVGIAQYGSEKF